MLQKRSRRFSACLNFALIVLSIAASAQEREFHVDPAQSSIKFTLSDVLHTVHGTFQVKQGVMQLRPDGKMWGEIIVDATSGNSGNGMRDRKMHKEVLESALYPEIRFRPDRLEGAVASVGKSTVTVHGVFTIHGAEREISVPAALQMIGELWSVNVHLTIPYAKWGMRNPSTLFLKVSDSVEIDLALAGSLGKTAAALN